MAAVTLLRARSDLKGALDTAVKPDTLVNNRYPDVPVCRSPVYDDRRLVIVAGNRDGGLDGITKAVGNRDRY